jgi:L-aspartate oxidase
MFPQAFADRRYLIPFRSQLLPHIFTDTLVIGGGVAGMSAAIEAAADGGDVILLMKDELGTSSTAWAQGGIAVATGAGDSPDAHFGDTIAAGADLCAPAAARTLVEEGPACIERLLEWGMRFDRDEQGELRRGREAAHSRERILHTDGAATGRALVECLARRLEELETVRVFRRCFALDLLTMPGTPGPECRVLGAITHHPTYGLQIIWARSTVLAAGGCGQVYRETTNPRPATGDGIAMAFRAGAAVADVELMQFHPTTLYVAGASRMLISEAVRGEGAHLVDQHGKRFMESYHPDGELAPRDVVSRAIVDQLARTQAEAVYLDARHLGADALAGRFPDLLAELSAFELDPTRDLIPVHPSAHYMIGGAWTDLDGRTTLPGLLACGEAACTGLHGANRLASNSLLEGLVFGRRAGRTAARATDGMTGPIRIVSSIPVPEHAELDLVDVRSSVRSTMWRNVGIERGGTKLDDVLDMFGFWTRYTMDNIFDEPDGWEIQNLLLLGALMTRAAGWRTESRGVHCRLDHPEADPTLRVHARWSVGSDEPVLQPVADPAEVTPT